VLKLRKSVKRWDLDGFCRAALDSDTCVDSDTGGSIELVGEGLDR